MYVYVHCVLGGSDMFVIVW